MEKEWSDKIKEEMKKAEESELLTEARKAAEKKFGKDFFKETHLLLLETMKTFASNEKSRLSTALGILNGRVSFLAIFMVENELILSDELKRRCKEKFIGLYEDIYIVLERFLKLEDEEKNNVQEKQEK